MRYSHLSMVVPCALRDSGGELMGRWRNGRIFSALAALTIAAVSALSLLLIAVALGREFGV